MDEQFKIYRDDTIACLFADYVIWACREGTIEYAISPKLRSMIQDEINHISKIMKAGG